MNGILLKQEDGVLKESVVKTNYIFTVRNKLIEKTICHLNRAKKQEICESLKDKLNYCHSYESRDLI